MSEKKIYKKGSKVFLCCSTHDAQSLQYEEYELEADYTEEELEKLAEEYFWNTKEPSWWFQEDEPEDRW